MDINKISTAPVLPAVQPIKVQTPKVTAPVQQAALPSTDISYNKDAGMYVIKFVDKDSNTVVKQLPTEAMVELATQMNKTLGAIINTKA